MKKFIEDLNKQLDTAKVVRSSNSHYNKGYLFGINTAKVLLHETYKNYQSDQLNEIGKKGAEAGEAFAKLITRFSEGLKDIRQSGLGRSIHSYGAPHFEFRSGSPIANEKGPERSYLSELLKTDFRKKYSEPIFNLTDDEKNHFSDSLAQQFVDLKSTPKWSELRLSKLGLEKQNEHLKRECKNWKTLFHQAQSEKVELETCIQVLNVEQREMQIDITECKNVNDRRNRIIADKNKQIGYLNARITDLISVNDKLISEVDCLHNIKNRSVGNYEVESLKKQISELHQDIERKNFAFAEHTEMLINELAEFKEKNYFSRNQATHSPAEYQEHQIATYQKQISELNHNLERQNKNSEFAWSKVDKIKTERNFFMTFAIIFLFIIFYLIN